MRRIMFMLVIGAVIAIAVPAVSAQDNVITVPIDTVVRAPQGSITELESVDVPVEYQGRTCVGEAESENQDSVHPGNNLIITTGDATVVIPDVEGSADLVELVTGPFTLGPTVTVSLEMGPDEVFSGGFLGFVVDCQLPPPTTTTTTTTTTSTTVPPTTVPTTVPPTTVPPPTVVPTTVPPPTVVPSTVVPSTVVPTTLPATGSSSSEGGLVGGLALVTAGAIVLVALELHRRTRSS